MQPAIDSPGGAADLAAQGNRHPDQPRPAYWVRPPVDLVRWNKSYPYQLLVLRREGDTWRTLDDWQFTLPVPPRSLRISAPPPTELHLNQDGAVEVVAEQRLRTLQITGTMGVLPGRPSAPRPPVFPILAGRVTANLYPGGTDPSSGQLPASVVSDQDVDGTLLGRSSGYAQFLLLEGFLDAYHAAKARDPGLQLAFAAWKTQSVYLVSMRQFDLVRQVPDVLGWPYVLAADSFGSVALDRSAAALTQPPDLTDPSRLAALLDSVRGARLVVAQSVAAISTYAGGLAATVTDTVRELCLAVSDLAGAASTLADLPADLVRSASGAVVSLLSARSAAAGVPSSVLDGLAKLGSEVDDLRALGAALGRSDTRTAVSPYSGPLANSPAWSIFSDPGAHIPFLAGLTIGALQLTPQVRAAAAIERSRVASLGRGELAARRDALELVADTLARATGWGAGSTGGSDSALELLCALADNCSALDALAVHAGSEDATSASARYVSGLYRAAGVPFTVARSKLPVPYPYGCTLEQVAERYLGDPDRVGEVVNLNGLVAPFVDEVGYALNLAAPPVGDRVLLAADGSRLRVGQLVYLSSRTAPEAEFQVLRLSPSGLGWLAQLDRDASAYLPAQGAQLRAYRPNTLRGGLTMWVPSPDEAPPLDFDEDPNFPGSIDAQLRSSGADLLLDESGDLVVTQDGDCRYARGLALVVQVVRDGVGTVRGSKLRHPEYGLPEAVGESLADLDPAQQAAAVRQVFVGDPLFDGVDSVSVTQGSGRMVVTGNVGVRALGATLPMSVELAR